jgi:hypothetical protein
VKSPTPLSTLGTLVHVEEGFAACDIWVVWSLKKDWDLGRTKDVGKKSIAFRKEHGLVVVNTHIIAIIAEYS